MHHECTLCDVHRPSCQLEHLPWSAVTTESQLCDVVMSVVASLSVLGQLIGTDVARVSGPAIGHAFVNV